MLNKYCERCGSPTRDSLQDLSIKVADLSRTISTDSDGAWWGDWPEDHLGNIAGYIGRIEALHDKSSQAVMVAAERALYDDALILKLDDALVKAVEVIKQWHNMGGGADVWQIYYENAPEMKLIRETLTRSTDRR